MRKRTSQYDRAVKEFKRAYLLRAIAAERGVMTREARKIGVHRNTMDRMLKELGMNSYQLRVMVGFPGRCTPGKRNQRRAA